MIQRVTAEVLLSAAGRADLGRRLWCRCAALGAGWTAAMPGCKIDLPRPSLARDTAALHLLGPCSPTETSSGCRNLPPRLPSSEWFQVTPNPITCMEMDASGEDDRGPASSSLKRQIHRKLSSPLRSTVWQLVTAVTYFPLGCLSHISPDSESTECSSSTMCRVLTLTRTRP